MLQVKIQKHLPDFSLEMDFSLTNRILVLFGPSGSGKTTLLRCIAGLTTPDSGKICLDGITYYDSERGLFLPPRQRRVAYMFQEYALFPHMNVRQNIRYGLSKPDSTTEDLYASLLDSLKISHLIERDVRQLSGGEQQRVALARALVTQPKVLLLDEPLSSLDWDTRQELQQELRTLQELWRIPFVLVTHHRDEAESVGDDIIFLAQGKPRTPPLDCSSPEARLLLGAEDEELTGVSY